MLQRFRCRRVANRCSLGHQPNVPAFETLEPGRLSPGAYGYTAGVQPRRRPVTILMWLARQHLLFLWKRLPGGKRARVYSINVMRVRHPAWFREDLERLFGLLATCAIRPRVAERISFDEVA